MKEKIRILIVDDEENFRFVLGNELEKSGFEVKSAGGGDEALASVSGFKPEVALVDIQMPGMDGLTLMKELEKTEEPPEAVVITGHSTVENAVEAMKLGAVDYITKPFNMDELLVVIRKAFDKFTLRRQNRMLKGELAGRGEAPDIVGQSPVIAQILDIIGRVGPTDAATLIQGESGSGKELVARAVHKNSPRRSNPFIVVDCCSLQPTLLENELFGHEAGAYTGAIKMKHGLFEVADSGTIFLDEIGEISPEIQAKLLRVLETSTFRRVGSTRNIQVNVRMIAATNRNIRQLVEENKFREDLFYRLNIVTISVPPLRKRKEDIPLLCEYFLANSSIAGAERKVIPDYVMEHLMMYDWLGNVRELKNALKRAVILSEGDELTIGDFHLPSKYSLAKDSQPSKHEDGFVTLDEIERDYIQRVLDSTKGHRRKAAQILGISERNLYRKIKNFTE